MKVLFDQLKFRCVSSERIEKHITSVTKHIEIVYFLKVRLHSTFNVLITSIKRSSKISIREISLFHMDRTQQTPFYLVYRLPKTHLNLTQITQEQTRLRYVLILS